LRNGLHQYFDLFFVDQIWMLYGLQRNSERKNSITSSKWNHHNSLNRGKVFQSVPIQQSLLVICYWKTRWRKHSMSLIQYDHSFL